MQVDVSPVFLPATVNIMTQFAVTSKHEYHKEVKYYVKNIKSGNTIYYPKSLLRLMDSNNLEIFFNPDDNSAQQFLDGLSNLTKISRPDQEIYFFKLNRLFSLVTGCNVRYVNSVLTHFGNEFSMDKDLRNLLKSLPFYLSYQEIEFHMMYKAIKILYVFDSIIDKKRMLSRAEELNYFLLMYLIQLKKYINLATSLEEVLEKGEQIFNGTSTSAKGIVFNKLCKELRKEFFTHIEKIIYPGFQEMLDFNKEVENTRLLELQNYISRWLHFIQYYLTIRFKLYEPGMQVIGKIADFGKYSQGPSFFFMDKDTEYSDIFQKPIYSFSQLINYFRAKYDNKFPLQIFTMINNLSKESISTQTFLGLFDQVSTILNVYNLVKVRTKIINPLIIFNRLLEKSKDFNESEINYYFNIYFQSQKFLDNSLFKNNRKAFNQYFFQVSRFERQHLIQLKRAFKRNFQNVNENLFGLAATKAITIYNYILRSLYNHDFAINRFAIMIRSEGRFSNHYISEDLNTKTLKTLFFHLYHMNLENNMFEAKCYIEDIEIQFLTYPNRNKLDDPNFKQIVKNKDINDAYVAFNKYSNLMGETPKLPEKKSEKGKIIINLVQFLKKYESQIQQNTTVLNESKDIFSNVLDEDTMMNQTQLIETLDTGILQKAVLNKFEMIDEEHVLWLSLNGEVSGLQSFLH